MSRARTARHHAGIRLSRSVVGPAPTGAQAECAEPSIGHGRRPSCRLGLLFQFRQIMPVIVINLCVLVSFGRSPNLSGAFGCIEG
jgi:hypothetical protein